MILFFRHGSCHCQVLSKKQIKAAGEVALGWVPLDFTFALCLPFFVEHTSLGFGYVWIQYLIDLGENKIQGSQACRILLGSMVGIYWIYALFGGSPFFGAEKDAARTRHKKEKHYGLWLQYLITPFCFYKAWNTYLKTGLGYVWIQHLIDFGENKIQGSQACRILLGCMVGIYWIYALFGGHYCLGRKGCSQNTPQKRKK